MGLPVGSQPWFWTPLTSRSWSARDDFGDVAGIDCLLDGDPCSPTFAPPFETCAAIEGETVCGDLTYPIDEGELTLADEVTPGVTHEMSLVPFDEFGNAGDICTFTGWARMLGPVAWRGRLSPIKVTPPRLSGSRVVLRERLFARLERGLQRGRVWVHGPAGTGKTTLVASWCKARGLRVLWDQLDAADADPATFFHFLNEAYRLAFPRRQRMPPAFSLEQAGALGPFTRGWLAHLEGLRGTGAVIVLDDVQEVPAGSPLDEVLKVMFAAAPSGVTVIGVSRSATPAWLAPAVASGGLELIGGDALLLDEAETAAIVAASGTLAAEAPETVRRLRELSSGWALGLGFLLRSLQGRPSPTWLAEHEATSALFDYLAAEVLSQMEATTRTLLVKTAHLSGFSAAHAEAVTGVVEAERILARLARDGTFVQAHGGASLAYSYHPLFASFLERTAARELEDAERRRLLGDSAALLAAEGQPHAAAELYREAGAFDALGALICASAPGLLAEGQARTLSGWIDWLPEADVDASGWLLYWRAQCVFAPAPLAAHDLFAQALQRFEADADGVGSLLAWAGAVSTIWGLGRDFRPFDAWVTRGEALVASLPAPPPPWVELEFAGAMCVALAFRQPASRHLPRYRARVLELAISHRAVMLRIPFASLAIVIHDINHRGDVLGAQHAADVLLSLETAAAAPVIVRLAAQWTRAMVYFFAGRFAESRRAAAAGLQLVEESGVHWLEPHLLWFLALSEIPGGDVQAAAQAIARAEALAQPPELVTLGLIHLVAGWHALASGDAREAWNRLQRLRGIQDQVGMGLHDPLFDLAEALVRRELGSLPEARSALARGQAVAREQASAFYTFTGHIVAADLALADGRRQDAVAPLAEALAFAREHSLGVSMWWRRRSAARLLGLALAHGIEVEYARHLIALHDLADEPPDDDISAWPWRVRVRTFGGLEVEVGGRRLSDGQLRGRPGELLQVLIACGGVKVPEATFIDTLWPDGDPGAAHSAFSTNLQRLRKLLGVPHVLVLADARLSLDSRRVWTDARAFGRQADLVDGFERAVTPLAVADLERAGERLLGLYRGSFLGAERGAEYATASRLRFEARFRGAIAAVGVRLEAAGALKSAASLYARALDRDPLAEEIYERQARTQIDLGRPTEALAVVERARAALSQAYGVEPGDRLLQLARRARRQ